MSPKVNLTPYLSGEKTSSSAVKNATINIWRPTVFQRLEKSILFPFPLSLFVVGAHRRAKGLDRFNCCIKESDIISYEAGEYFSSPAGEIKKGARGGNF
jgi:hypothetical protein